MTNCPHCGGGLPLTEFGKRTAIPTHSHHSSLTFGKYQGTSVRELLKTDPKYLAWVHNNVESVVFIPELVDEIAQAVLTADDKEANKRSWPQPAFTSPHDFTYEDVDLDDDVPF